MVRSLERGRDEPCKCATTRFLKKHPEIIMDATGRAWWPADELPALKTGEAPADG
jgi:hypothetical protein